MALDARTSKIVLNRADGQDVLYKSGTNGDDRVQWRNGRLNARSPGMQLTAPNFLSWQLNGKQGNDTLKATSTDPELASAIGRQHAVLVSGDSSVTAEHFE